MKSHVTVGWQKVPELSGFGGWLSMSKATMDFRAWAKTEKLGDLKKLAVGLGLDAAHTKGATRTEVQNWLASKWDKHVTAPDLSVPKAPKAPKAEKPPTPAVPSPVPATSPAAAPQAPKAGQMVGVKRAFSAKKSALMAKIAHHVASARVLPPRRAQADVDGLALSPVKDRTVGGSHEKRFFRDADNREWMFKPDKTNGGARGHAEAAASVILAQAGIPTVPVYTRKADGKLGSIQPMVDNTGNLPSTPSSWSQADVDAIVRLHVAAWAVGDHDGNPDNLLRTEGGGLVACDQGQAFKFIGSDRLSLDYTPNSAYGSVPVFHQVYKAAGSGGLAQGVKVRPVAAGPVIDRIQAIPDTQYRQMLHAAAHEGAKHKVAWYKTMRARAAKAAGSTDPTDSQVAEAFLDTMCERKASLRSDFQGFLGGLGLSSSAVAA
ncbi:MAG: hypothetical protein ACRD0J_04050 [Acidimicrobiales bacterium]